MKYLFVGIIAGIILNIFILFPSAGRAIIPEFNLAIKTLEPPKTSLLNSNKKSFNVRAGKSLWKISPVGHVSGKITAKEELAAFSGSGSYYITYKKVGKEIEFFNESGSRFWKLKSLEYPYLSRNGKLIFLMNGDHSRIRVVNHNGNLENAPSFAGRLCTVITFSPENDFGAGGFLDGSFFLVGPQRQILYRGMTLAGKPVKGLAVSSTGKFMLVHCGTTEQDEILVIDLEKKNTGQLILKSVQVSQSTLLVDDTGRGTAFDGDRIIHFDKGGDEIFSLDVAPKRDGHAALVHGRGFIVGGYTDTQGTGRAIIFDLEGRIIFSKICTGESLMDVSILGNRILLRGSDNLYSYSLHRVSEE